jgi:hypothetical protein
MRRGCIMFSALISVLTGCGEKLSPVPAKPGVSAPLAYPVVLAGERRLLVYDDQASLTTTSISSGVPYGESTLIDSAGAAYVVKKVTDFGQQNRFSTWALRDTRFSST